MGITTIYCCYTILADEYDHQFYFKKHTPKKIEKMKNHSFNYSVITSLYLLQNQNNDLNFAY